LVLPDAGTGAEIHGCSGTLNLYMAPNKDEISADAGSAAAVRAGAGRNQSAWPTFAPMMARIGELGSREHRGWPKSMSAGMIVAAIGENGDGRSRSGRGSFASAGNRTWGGREGNGTRPGSGQLGTVGGGVICLGRCVGTEVGEDRLRILVPFRRVVRPSRTSIWHAPARKNSG
jgi:hypothetical protein